ncbi:MAG: hypothetical protein QOD10_5271, partial [Mycobacterium sp.]|nr:hypothetical protein [Mycobacterium sp.]
FWLTPSDITAGAIEELILRDAAATVITIRLATSSGRRQLSAWVRYHSDRRLSRHVSSGLNRLTGRQLAAVRASLPAPVARPLLVVPSRSLLDDDDLVLSVGQVPEGSASVPVAQ